MLRLLLIVVLWSLASSSFAQAKLAIIIDDLGYNLELGRRSLQLPGAITVAILPFTPHAQSLAEYAHQHGKEIMLHAPMSNKRKLALGPGALLDGMQKTEFLAILRRDLANIPYVRGLNNHMGSQLTEQAEPMSWLMEELKAQRLYFVDSRTSAGTQALHMAERIQLPSRKRDIFLDDERDQQVIRAQLIKAMQLARKNGATIAIGHPYPETLAVLQDLPELLLTYKVELVSASALMHNTFPPLAAAEKTASCPAPPPWLWLSIKLPIDPFSLQAITHPFNL